LFLLADSSHPDERGDTFFRNVGYFKSRTAPHIPQDGIPQLAIIYGPILVPRFFICLHVVRQITNFDRLN
jgi:hypothetical protein